MDDDSTPDSKQHYHVAVQADREGFVRLTCPSCGLDFKVEADDAQLQHALDLQVRRVEPELSGAEESDEKLLQLTCPYCGNRNETVEMQTEETMTYLHRIVHREIVAPMLNDFVEDIGRMWNRGSSGSISFKAETSRQMLPPRPFHGPEPPDMKVIEFLCCGKQAKIHDRWYVLNCCPFCESDVRLI